MVGIAIAMLQETGLSNHIAKEPLLRIIARLFEAFPQNLFKYETAANQRKPSLKERLNDRDAD